MFNMVFLFQDDFGYAALSYIVVEPDVNGTHYSIGQLFDFLWNHYLSVNGRNFLLHTVLLSHIGLYRVFMAVSTTLVFYLMYRFTGKRTMGVAIFVCLSYGLFPIHTYRTGFYWFSAAINNVFPLTLVFFGLLLLKLIDRDKKANRVRKSRVLVCCICLFIAAAMHEQIAIWLCMIIATLYLYEFIKRKKISLPQVWIGVLTIAGSMISVLSPGNFSRFIGNSNPIPLHERIADNYLTVLKKVYCDNIAFVIVITIFIAYLIFCEYKANRISNKITVLLIPFSLLLPIVSGCQLFSDTILFLYTTAYSALVIIIVLRYLLRQKERYIGAVFSGSILSYIVIIVISPYIVERALIILQLSIFIVMSYVLSQEMRKVSLKAVFLIVVLIVSGYTLIHSSMGYYGNLDVNKYNDQILKYSSEAIKKGEQISTIMLAPYPEPMYAGDFFDRARRYMCQYYDFPDSVTTQPSEIYGTKVSDDVISLYGYYPDDGWVAKSSAYNVKSGPKGIIRIYGYYPAESTETITGNVIINGKEKVPFTVESDGQVLIDIKVPPNSDNFISIENDFVFEHDLSVDVRELSFQLISMTGE
jgi:hypothetical protein